MTSCFSDDFLMLNDPKVEASSKLPRQSSANFVNLWESSKMLRNVRMAFEPHSDNLLKSSVKKLQKVARKKKGCSKEEKLFKSCLTQSGQAFRPCSPFDAASLACSLLLFPYAAHGLEVGLSKAKLAAILALPN